MNYTHILTAIEDALFSKQLLIDAYKSDVEKLKAENEELKKDIEVLECQLMTTEDRLHNITRGTQQCE